MPNTNAAQAEVFAVVLLDAIRAATFSRGRRADSRDRVGRDRLGDGSRG